MTLYLKGHQKYDRSKLKVQLLLSKYIGFQLLSFVSLIPIDTQGHTVPQLKALSYDRYERRGHSCGSTSSICQDILKSDNLLHKRGFVKTQSLHTAL